VVTTYGYDVVTRLATLTVISGSGVLWAERYGYNAAGERIYVPRRDNRGETGLFDFTIKSRGAERGTMGK